MDIRIAPTSSGRAVLFKTRLRSEEPREFQRLRLFGRDKPPRIRHGICPDCSEMLGVS